MQDNRDFSLDALRGIAIIAVVAIHAIYLAGNPDAPYYIYYRQILNFAVPVFFFMAGYWASREKVASFDECKMFLKRRLSRICLPYLFWSVIFLGLSFIKARDINLQKGVFSLLTGGACMGYYFIIAIAQLYVLTPLLQLMNRKLKLYGLLAVLVFNLAAIYLLYLSRMFNVIGHLPIALPFYSWIIYYEAGLLISDSADSVFAEQKNRIFILTAILISAFISIYESSIIALKFQRPDFAVSVAKFSSLLYSACMISGFFALREYFARLPKMFGTIGCYSFGIYLIHVFVLNRVVLFFRGIGADVLFEPLFQFVLVIVTLLICFIIIRLAREWLPVYFYSRILGF
jgi:probable poly-beta-1,6-N-acetyl-D-glucosamine export protein